MVQITNLANQFYLQDNFLCIIKCLNFFFSFQIVKSTYPVYIAYDKKYFWKSKDHTGTAVSLTEAHLDLWAQIKHLVAGCKSGWRGIYGGIRGFVA